jgi:hypothetical protein
MLAAPVVARSDREAGTAQIKNRAAGEWLEHVPDERLEIFQYEMIDES